MELLHDFLCFLKLCAESWELWLMLLILVALLLFLGPIQIDWPIV